MKVESIKQKHLYITKVNEIARNMIMEAHKDIGIIPKRVDISIEYEKNTDF
jgi:hypothetical protein